jgi:hypothetical protein
MVLVEIAGASGFADQAHFSSNASIATQTMNIATFFFVNQVPSHIIARDHIRDHRSRSTMLQGDKS